MNIANCKEKAIAGNLFDLVIAPIRWQLLMLGFELNIFDRLKQPQRYEDLATALNLDSKQVKLILNAMCSIGFLNKLEQQYQVDESHAAYLITSSPRCMRDLLIHLGKIRHTSLENLLASLSADESDSKKSDFTGDKHWTQAISGLRSFHSSLSVHVVSQIFVKLPYWHRINNILDLGAGSEQLAQHLLKIRSDLNVTLFDLPKCIQRVEEFISRNNIQNIQLLRGDFNINPLGGPYDLIWCSMSLYYAKDLNAVLRKIKASLSPQGMFLSFHEGLLDDRTWPEAHVAGRLVPSLNGTDVSFDHGIIAKSLKDVGFSSIENRTIYTPYGPMDLDIATI